MKGLVRAAEVRVSASSRWTEMSIVRRGAAEQRSLGGSRIGVGKVYRMMVLDWVRVRCSWRWSGRIRGCVEGGGIFVGIVEARVLRGLTDAGGVAVGGGLWDERRAEVEVWENVIVGGWCLRWREIRIGIVGTKKIPVIRGAQLLQRRNGVVFERRRKGIIDSFRGKVRRTLRHAHITPSVSFRSAHHRSTATGVVMTVTPAA